ncbi:rhodanese-like domain-containing protein [Psychroflexus aestuariivivens]|uniref:rhodanese-like domain-containing protein n=1 Tax=Psychroflexus aestuariivivens TaxID=1795040 RepID=UPI000FDB8153|nr:rhodanese-like domain-containing protein [Psychroflexus aestuariivivens]
MKFFSIFFILFSQISAGQETIDVTLANYNNGSVEYISVQNLKNLLNKKDFILLDVRTPKEFNISHIKNAEFINYEDFNLSNIERKYHKNSQIIVYCSVGVRSEKFGEKLIEAGFKNIKNLYGGIFLWKNSGFNVVDFQEKPTENIHVYHKRWEHLLTKGNAVSN